MPRGIFSVVSFSKYNLQWPWINVSESLTLTCSQTLSTEMKKNNKTATAIKQIIEIFHCLFDGNCLSGFHFNLFIQCPMLSLKRVSLCVCVWERETTLYYTLYKNLCEHFLLQRCSKDIQTGTITWHKVYSQGWFAFRYFVSDSQ